MNGTIYLIHFDQPFGHAQHYLGWARDVEARIAHHRNGSGANLLRHVNEAGITWQVVRTWPNMTKNDERRMKIGSHAPQYCPICNPNPRSIRQNRAIA